MEKPVLILHFLLIVAKFGYGFHVRKRETFFLHLLRKTRVRFFSIVKEAFKSGTDSGEHER